MFKWESLDLIRQEDKLRQNYLGRCLVASTSGNIFKQLNIYGLVHLQLIKAFYI